MQRTCSAAFVPRYLEGNKSHKKHDYNIRSYSMRASSLLIALTVVLVTAAASEAQIGHSYFGATGRKKGGGHPGGKPNPGCPGGNQKPWPCPVPNPCYPNPWPCRPSGPHCNWPPVCGGYGDYGTYWPPTIYPPIYTDGPYDMSPFTAWLNSWGTVLRYYEADPVQYSYTPIDIPPRAPVVRPTRPVTHLRIVPRQVRRPLYERMPAVRGQMEVN
jgi:hypothetical protein